MPSQLSSAPIALPSNVLLQAYGALGACAHHLRNLPATTEGDDARLAKLAQDAFDAISAANEAALGRVSTYVFDAGPAGWEHENIEVVHTGRVENGTWNPLADVWAIRKRGWCWNSEDGVWEHEPMPSSRDDEFFERCRFTLEQALPLAAEIRDVENARRADAR